jgi:hypothetical protein
VTQAEKQKTEKTEEIRGNRVISVVELTRIELALTCPPDPGPFRMQLF